MCTAVILRRKVYLAVVCGRRIFSNLVSFEQLYAYIIFHSCNYIVQCISTVPSCMNIFRHILLNSCKHISPIQLMISKPLQGLYTKETTCIPWSIFSHNSLDLITPVELQCLWTKHQLDKKLIYSAAVEHVVLEESFSLLLTKELI